MPAFRHGSPNAGRTSPHLVAIDGKTSRRSHDRKPGQNALHLVSAFATRSRLVLGQEAVEEKSNEITAIPALLERIDLAGALVSIDAMGCNPGTAQAILDAKADYLLAGKDNQPTLHNEVKSHFDTAPSGEVERCETLGKDHGRIDPRPLRFSCRRLDHLRALLSGRPPLPQARRRRHGQSRIERADRVEPNGDLISVRASSRPKPLPRPCEATGPSKTTFTGPST